MLAPLDPGIAGSEEEEEEEDEPRPLEEEEEDKEEDVEDDNGVGMYTNAIIKTSTTTTALKTIVSTLLKLVLGCETTRSEAFPSAGEKSRTSDVDDLSIEP